MSKRGAVGGGGGGIASGYGMAGYKTDPMPPRDRGPGGSAREAHGRAPKARRVDRSPPGHAASEAAAGYGRQLVAHAEPQHRDARTSYDDHGYSASGTYAARPGAAFGGAPMAISDLPDEPEMVVEVEIPFATSWTVVGKSGATAAHIRRTHNVQVHVRRDPTESGKGIVELKGTRKMCERATKDVRELVTAAQSNATLAVVGEVDITVDVPPDAIGHVLGPRGAKAKSIEQRTGARLKIFGRINEAGKLAVVVSGQPQPARVAYDELRSILQKWDDRTRKPGSRPAVSPPAAAARDSARETSRGPAASDRGRDLRLTLPSNASASLGDRDLRETLHSKSSADLRAALSPSSNAAVDLRETLKTSGSSGRRLRGRSSSQDEAPRSQYEEKVGRAARDASYSRTGRSAEGRGVDRGRSSEGGRGVDGGRRVDGRGVDGGRDADRGRSVDNGRGVDGGRSVDGSRGVDAGRGVDARSSYDAGGGRASSYDPGRPDSNRADAYGVGDPRADAYVGAVRVASYGAATRTVNGYVVSTRPDGHEPLRGGSVDAYGVSRTDEYGGRGNTGYAAAGPVDPYGGSHGTRGAYDDMSLGRSDPRSSNAYDVTPVGSYTAAGGSYPAPGGSYPAPNGSYPAPGGSYPAPGAPPHGTQQQQQQGQPQVQPMVRAQPPPPPRGPGATVAVAIAGGSAYGPAPTPATPGTYGVGGGSGSFGAGGGVTVRSASGAYGPGAGGYAPGGADYGAYGGAVMMPGYAGAGGGGPASGQVALPRVQGMAGLGQAVPHQQGMAGQRQPPPPPRNPLGPQLGQQQGQPQGQQGQPQGQQAQPQGQGQRPQQGQAQQPQGQGQQPPGQQRQQVQLPGQQAQQQRAGSIPPSQPGQQAATAMAPPQQQGGGAGGGWQRQAQQLEMPAHLQVRQTVLLFSAFGTRFGSH
ncbi:hypothetical protein FOA52_004400 [Chlamydomonas sp. UWO 241]|nr:hypothetical protein FOA52_004400 [Chlamydomonas sp. UWO 241]